MGKIFLKTKLPFTEPLLNNVVFYILNNKLRRRIAYALTKTLYSIILSH